MHFDATIHLGDVIMAVTGLVLIPVTRLLVRTLWQLRDALKEHAAVLFGSDRDPSTGLVTIVGALRRDAQKTALDMRDVKMELGMKADNRS